MKAENPDFVTLDAIEAAFDDAHRAGDYRVAARMARARLRHLGKAS
jgi:hypothetical protein